MPAMRCPVMGEVAALAECCEVSGSVVAGVLVEMGGGEDDIGRRQGQRCKACQSRLQSNKAGREGQCPRATATVVTPALAGHVPPQSVGSDDHPFSVRSPATLAAAAGAIEADHLRQLAPVDRVEPALVRADRRKDSMSHWAREQKV